jgi:peptide/nickel transport system permease protein
MRRLRTLPRSARALVLAVGLLALVALLGPYIAPYNPTAIGSAADQLLPPSLDHPFGTDQVGRDVFSRVLAGARESLAVAVAVAAFAAAFGTTMGLLAGLGNRVADEVVMRVTDIFFAFPYLILAMAVVASLGPGSLSVIVALAAIWWPSYARQVRGHVLALKSSGFVDASRVVGNSGLRTAIRHVVPQMYSELAVRVSLDLGNVILIASALGFLGLGPRPPSPDWGSILFEARAYTVSAWWLSVFPGLALTLAVLLFSLLGDSLSQSRSRPRRLRTIAT